jgi:putative membrane protein
VRRTALLAAGLAALAAAWLGPLPALATGSFAAHMAMHMGVVAIAAPLLALGLAGGRLDPVARWPALFPPVPWAIGELVVVWAWHTPALHHAARHAAPGLVVEQLSFLAVGLAVWISAVGGGARRRADRRGAGVLALLLTSMHMTLLGALLALPPRALFHHGGAADALSDQHLGGAIMLVVGGAAYLAGGLGLALGLVHARVRGDRPLDGDTEATR